LIKETVVFSFDRYKNTTYLETPIKLGVMRNGA